MNIYTGSSILVLFYTSSIRSDISLKSISNPMASSQFFHPKARN